MDLENRKLNAIEYLITIQDENIFERIEETISKAKDKENLTSSKKDNKENNIENPKK